MTSTNNDQCDKPGPVSQAEAVEQRAAIGRNEEVEESGDLSAAMHLQPEDHMGDAGNSRPRRHVTPQMARYGIPHAKQEVGRADGEAEAFH